MKTLWNQIKLTSHFLRQSKAYFRDTLVMHALMLFVLIPALEASMKLILKLGGVKYLSSDNIPQIFQQHGVLLLALLLLLILTLAVLFFEFSFLLLSLKAIQDKQPLSVIQLFKITVAKLKKIRPATLLFFLLFLVLLLPLAGLGFHSDLLAKIKIPAFILDYIFQQRYRVVTSFIGGYLLLLLLAVRFIFVLPYLLLHDDSLKVSLQKSWRKTRGHVVQILLQIVGLYFAVLGVVSLIFLLIYHGQALMESWQGHWGLPGAVLALTLLQGLTLLHTAFLSALLFYVLLFWLKDDLPPLKMPRRFYPPREKRSLRIGRAIFLLGGLCTLFGGALLYNYHYLADFSFHTPLIISHRGVDLSGTPNGVQNSIAALTATQRLGVDFVEMDIFQTKDGEFAVVHDRNLKALTGHDVNIDDLTLAEATALTVKDNGMTAPLASFDDYLATAEKSQQPLLVELKITPQDSPELAATFVQRYGERLLQDGSWVQSLSYPLVEKVKALAPYLKVGYILPFNIIGPPTSNADFFVMEHTTLNSNFVAAAKADGKEVYAWTINDSSTMDRVLFYGATAVITDYVADLKTALNQQKDFPTYADKLLYYWIGIG
ncbi:glycerophosphodiester phosphodiesterase [Enterococcus nangangensis]|uniref:glycerophosphodiester phosphodiesterase n=1 Tax=Enterococcus nangangensis TaxID=2559926 RepID=UPI0010F9202D|nr:glycerophosphodiester phosphodiesterase [Enterococcus nangangensis]